MLLTQPLPVSSEIREAQSFLTGRGGLYLGARYGLGVLISLGNMFVLTWLLGPHVYGLFVTAIALTSVLANLVRSGLDTYLVRCERIPDRRDYDTASTAILSFSILAMAGGMAVVPLLTRWFHSAEFVPAFLVTMLTIPIVGLAGPVTGKLERALNFQTVAKIELTGQSLALVTGLTLALLRKGIWAPVAGQLVWQVFGLLAAFRAARYFPRLVLDRSRLGEMLAFGVGYTASQRTWQLRALVNPLIVGRFVGAEGVAFVGLAIRIAEGLGFLRTAASRLAVASLARLRHDSDLLRASLQKALRGQVIILGPLLDAFAIASPFVIHRVLGERWHPVLRIYPLIALAVLVNSIYNLQSAALVRHRTTMDRIARFRLARRSFGDRRAAACSPARTHRLRRLRLARVLRLSAASARNIALHRFYLSHTMDLGACVQRSAFLSLCNRSMEICRLPPRASVGRLRCMGRAPEAAQQRNPN